MTGPWELKLGIRKLVCLSFFNFFVSLMFSWLVMPVNEYIQNKTKQSKTKQNKGDSHHMAFATTERLALFFGIRDKRPEEGM